MGILVFYQGNEIVRMFMERRIIVSLESVMI